MKKPDSKREYEKNKYKKIPNPKRKHETYKLSIASRSVNIKLLGT